MHVVVCYDVVEDLRRQRLAKRLKGRLLRVQKSVFEGNIAESAYEPVKQMILEEIDRETDSVRIYTLCQRCVPALEVLGTGVFTDDEPKDVII